MVQFSSQLLFLMLMIGLSMGLGFGDVRTAQVSQAINAVQISFSFYLGWRLLPKTPATHSLPDGKHLLFQGFAQNWSTAKRIQRYYKKGLRWFLLALCFAEATANTFTLVAVVFLDKQLGFSGAEIGIFFAISLVCTIPGGIFARFVTSKSNPNTSWRLSMIGLFGLGIFGGLVLNRDNGSTLAYVWGAMVGITLGWFYPTERLFFSMIVPQGQEAELSGFYVYCTQIIGWLPPLLFSVLVEANVDQGIGVIAISGFAIIAVALLSMAAPWPEILADIEEEKSTDIQSAEA
jgi:MFS-type transporter involved in bile tolerance (Atg22 family)